MELAPYDGSRFNPDGSRVKGHQSKVLTLSRLQVENLVKSVEVRSNKLYEDLKDEGDESTAGLIMFLDTLASDLKELEKAIPFGGCVELRTKE